jgi:uncharacterized membrane protein
MSQTAEAVVLAVLILATSVWIGGYVALIVVARVATATLDPRARAMFFRTLGRRFFWVSVPALAIALVAGGVLARNSTQDGLLAAIIAIVAVLLVSFAIAVAQARRMTRLRRRLLQAPTDQMLQARVARGARAAGALRASLGLLGVTLIVLGSFLAVQ